MKGEIRNQRSKEVQGQRAGFVSQVAAGLLDAFTIFLLYTFVLVVYGVGVLFFTGNPFHLPQPDPWANALVYYVIGVVLLSSAWSGPGRAPGMAVVGLRVVDATGEPLSPRRAFWRAVITVASVGIGLVTVLFSRRNKSLYDMICKSAVLYDWRPSLAESRQNQ